MKKKLIAIALALVATASFGWVSVTWDAAALLSANDASVYATADSQTTQILWDLIYTTSSSIATPTLGTDGGITYGSDTLLSTRLWNAGDETVSVTDIQKGNADEISATDVPMVAEEGYIDGPNAYKNSNFDASAGKLYSAVFQYLDNGDVYYAVTDLYAVAGWDGSGVQPTPGSVSFPMDNDGTQIATKLGSVEPGPTEVPEPATMSLLGLGALAMVIRRKLRK